MIKLEKELFTQIVSHCIKEFPNEACGILAGKDTTIEKVYEMANVDKSPESYLMDGQDQLKIMKDIRNSNLEMLGIYHSHVASPAYPSRQDVELAFYPEVSYVIISIKDKENPNIRSFKIEEEKIIEEEVRIVEGCED